MKTRTLCALVLCQACAAIPAFACDYHMSLGIYEPDDSTDTTDTISLAPASPSVATANALTLASFGAVTSASGPVATSVTVYSSTDPRVTCWRQNLTGATGTSPNPTINALVSQIPADVQQVGYTTSNVYVHASDVPTHSVGPFPGNPAYPSNVNRTFEIPHNPTPATTHTATGLGAIGVMVNGVQFFNASDGHSYNNLNVWHQNANVVEGASFDAAPGHPAPNQGATGNPVPGTYHYHQAPIALLNQLDPGNTGQHHSPLLGFALDGYPIYGPYGYANADGTGGIVRETSSYALRTDMTQRTTLPNGTTASSAGPDVSTQYPLGYYLEDYKFVPNSGTLDQYNGRFVVTPEFPGGTYAYFTSFDATMTSVFPYLVGPQYYGIVDTNNLGQTGMNLTIPSDATIFVAPEPALGALMLPMLLSLRRRRNTK